MKTTNPPRNEIICGDAAEVMIGWPNECIDLTVTSPPYDLCDYDETGNLVTYPAQGLRDYEGYDWDFVSIAQQLWRVTKRGGVCVWVVGDMTIDGSETCTPDRQKLYFKSLGFRVHDTMIYQSDKPPRSDNRYHPNFEFMFVFSKERPKTVNLIKRIVKRPGHSHGKFRQSNGSLISAKTTQKIKGTTPLNNVWYYYTGRDEGDKIAPLNPARFPEALAADHIRSWSNPGDLVLDLFSGSGTTAKMAYLLERDYAGIDISANYCDIARRRVAAATMPIIEAVKAKPEQLALGLEGAEE
jgi:site-specific DNA-methyltransferase (adenine-specific)